MANTRILWFQKFFEKRFHHIFDLIIAIAIISLIILLICIFFDPDNPLTAFSLTNFGVGMFSIVVGIVTFIALLMAIAELKMRFDKIINFDDFLKEASDIVLDAQNFVAMLCWYPSFGILSMKMQGRRKYKKCFYDYQQKLIDKIDKINKELDMNEEKAEEFKIYCCCLSYTEQQKVLSVISDKRYRYDNATIEEIVATNLMMNNKIYSFKNSTFIKKSKNELPPFQIIFNENKAAIFIPLDLGEVDDGEKGNQDENKLSRENIKRHNPVGILGNVTMDDDIIDRFKQLFYFYSGSEIEE